MVVGKVKEPRFSLVQSEVFFVRGCQTVAALLEASFLCRVSTATFCVLLLSGVPIGVILFYF